MASRLIRLHPFREMKDKLECISLGSADLDRLPEDLFPEFLSVAGHYMSAYVVAGRIHEAVVRYTIGKSLPTIFFLQMRVRDFITALVIQPDDVETVTAEYEEILEREEAGRRRA